MKLPRPRLTVRRLMIAVAISAVLLGSYVLVRKTIERRQYLLQMIPKLTMFSRMRSQQMENYQQMRKANESTQKAAKMLYPSYGRMLRRQQRLVDECRVEAERFRKKAEHWDNLRAKYLQASNRPWLPLIPDPPEPD